MQRKIKLNEIINSSKDTPIFKLKKKKTYNMHHFIDEKQIGV
jgi:hypothetical protein